MTPQQRQRIKDQQEKYYKYKEEKHQTIKDMLGGLVMFLSFLVFCIFLSLLQQ